MGFCAASQSVAQPDNGRVIRLSQQAQIAFQQGRSKDAIRIYLEAYRKIDADPSLLYNVAYIYERMGDIKSARSYYRQVSQSPRASAELRVKAYERKDQLPTPKVAVPLLSDQPAPSPPVKRRVVRPSPPIARPKAPSTARPVKPKPPVKAPPSTPVVAKKPPAARSAKADEEDRARLKRMSPEQRRREEMRRRRAAREASGQ